MVVVDDVVVDDVVVVDLVVEELLTVADEVVLLVAVEVDAEVDDVAVVVVWLAVLVDVDDAVVEELRVEEASVVEFDPELVDTVSVVRNDADVRDGHLGRRGRSGCRRAGGLTKTCGL